MASLVRRVLPGVGILQVLLACVVTDASAEAALPGPFPVDTILSVVPSRPDSLVRQDMAAAQVMEEDASRKRNEATLERAAAKARVDVTKAEIAVLDDSIGAAKKQKLDDLRKRLERNKDRVERRQRLHEAGQELGRAKEDAAEMRVSYARQRLALHQLELELPMAGQTARPAAEAKMLEAAKKVQERAGDLADREKQVIERQMRVLEIAAEIRAKG